MFAGCTCWNIIFIFTETWSSGGKQNFSENNILLLMNPPYKFQEKNEYAYFTVSGLVCVA